MYMIWGWGHEVETLGLHLVDYQGDIGQDVVEGRGALVDDPKLNLALEEQGRYCGSWQDLDQKPARTGRLILGTPERLADRTCWLASLAAQG